MAKKRKKAGSKGFCDRTLQSYWRRAILSYYGNFCFICGQYKDDDQLECHHIVRRRHRVTKHDYRNGIPLCTDCHKIAHTKKGEIYISKNHEWYDELLELENVNVKDYRLQHCYSIRDLEEIEMQKLRKVIADYN